MTTETGTNELGMPLFSVVIPVFNRSDSIGPTLESVVNQSCADFECIIVDDGSDDGAALEQIVRALDDPRFRYLRRPNGGGGAARNSGIDAARGRFIAFLDSDDSFLPEKLMRCREVLADSSADLVIYSQARVDRGVGKYWIRPDTAINADQDVAEYLFVDNQFIPTPTIVLPTQLAQAVQFDPSLRKGQDLDFCLRLQRAGARFLMIAQPLVIWNDSLEGGRASRTRGYQAPLDWLEKSRPLLSDRAYRGYRATVLAYYMSRRHPFRALVDIIIGWTHAGVSLRTTLRQLARAFLPRRFYRWMVNRFVAFRGRLA